MCLPSIAVLSSLHGGAMLTTVSYSARWTASALQRERSARSIQPYASWHSCLTPKSVCRGTRSTLPDLPYDMVCVRLLLQVGEGRDVIVIDNQQEDSGKKKGGCCS